MSLIAPLPRRALTSLPEPANVLMDPATRRAVIADFGISRASEHTSTKTSIGTPIFMAPEMLMGHHYGKSVDVYSFGLLLWQAWYGKKPLEGLGAAP